MAERRAKREGGVLGQWLVSSGWWLARTEKEPARSRRYQMEAGPHDGGQAVENEKYAGKMSGVQSGGTKASAAECAYNNGGWIPTGVRESSLTPGGGFRSIGNCLKVFLPVRESAL